MEQASGENSCGSAIATTILCSIFVILASAISFWAIYKLYWKRKYGVNRLIVEDPESARGDYAFDNPAFKGDNSKNVSPFDNKWRTPERKTVDDFYTNVPIPRLVPLRGSDFTGLGIEVCGGLKEGIYVKKVMPQGPAANIVHKGDKITSVTIDFRHIVQEDAATILSYASPYNVQLELFEPSGAMPNFLFQHPSQSLLTHPLYRSRSQEDLETIERNARKKLFTKNENSYPTLQLDQQKNSYIQKPHSPTEIIYSHDEYEKKKSFKKIQNYIIDMVEEKFQTKSSNSPTSNSTDDKKNIKYGARILPSEMVNSPNKIQTDNDNNTNIEKIDIHPPEAMKRSKKKLEAFERQASIYSSGIKRESAGIPQEMTAELMQAAITALNNRKVNSIDRKYKGMALRPPNIESNDSVDYVMKDRFDNEVTSMKLKNTECTGQDEDEASRTDQNNAQQIELSSNYITVHQVSEEKTSEARKTASLGDLSTLGVSGNVTVIKTNEGTLGRAQSLEITDSNNPNVSEKIAPTQRNSHANNADSGEAIDLEAPCLGDSVEENMEAIQIVRLKRSYEWGNLEDAICDGKKCSDNQIFDKKISSSSMMSEVLAAADKFDYEINDIQLSNIIDDDLSYEFELCTTIDPNGTNNYYEPLPQQTTDETDSLTISHKSNVSFEIEAPEEIALQKENVESEMPESTSTTQSVSIQSTNVISPKSFNLEIEDLESETRSINTNSLSKKINEIDVNNDAKTSNYALSKIERPKSEVLKKLILQQSPKEDSENGMDSFSQNLLTNQPTDETIIDIAEMEPLDFLVSARTESNTKENQASPIFSSDFQGVSNISISSTDSNSFIEQVSPFFTNSENKSLAIGEDISEQSQITLDDEQINFKIQNASEVADSIVSSLKNEVFVVESLSSKKFQDTLLPASKDNYNSKSPTRGFVTEIRFPNTNNDKQMNEKNFSKCLEVQNKDYDSMKMSASIANPNYSFGSQSVIVQEDYVPRNSEIRFTTSTYQSPRQIENRSSQIDQIRSNFERSHTSEIPVAIRKMSTSSTPTQSLQSSNMTRVSPSKIPVFTSQKSSDNLRNNGSMNRVSITSIKNSSRNPSGK